MIGSCKDVVRPCPSYIPAQVPATVDIIKTVFICIGGPRASVLLILSLFQTNHLTASKSQVQRVGREVEMVSGADIKFLLVPGQGDSKV